MTGEPDDHLPLHDEAEARSKWRGDETLLDKARPEPPARRAKWTTTPGAVRALETIR